MTKAIMLTDSENKIHQMYHVLNRNISEIAEILDITPLRVQSKLNTIQIKLDFQKSANENPDDIANLDIPARLYRQLFQNGAQSIKDILNGDVWSRFMYLRGISSKDRFRLTAAIEKYTARCRNT